jgi:hypothetical protein
MKDKFKTRESLFKYIQKEYVGQENYYSSVNGVVRKLMSLVSKNINKVQLSDVKKAMNMYVNENNYDKKSSAYARWSYSTSMFDLKSRDKKDRLFFSVSWSERKLSVLDLLELTPDECMELFELYREFMSFTELAYEHLSNIGEYEKAEKVFADFMSTLDKGHAKKIAVVSDIPHDYKAVFSFYKKNKSIPINKYTINSYIFKAVNNRDYPLDRDLYRFAYTNFKKEINKADRLLASSSTEVAEGLSVSNFDLFENDVNLVHRVIKLSNYEDRKIMENLHSENPERLKTAIINFLNNQYKNGKAKSRFTRTYNRISDFLERRNDKLDILKLEDKLQSYVLLEIVKS